MKMEWERFLNANRVRVYPVLFFGLFYGLWGFWIMMGEGLVDVRGKIIGSDFLTMYAGSVFSNSPQPWRAYDTQSFHQIQNNIAGTTVLPLLWSYSPIAFLLVRPLAWLPYLTAYLLWISMTAVFFLGILKKLMVERKVGWIALSSAGFYLNWIQGQNGFFTGALLGWGFFCLESRPLMAGFLLGLLSYKPQMAFPAFLFLLITWKWRPLLAMVICMAGLALLSAVCFGIQSWRGFLENISLTLFHVNEQNCPVYKMITVYAAVILSGGTPDLARMLQGGWTVVLMGWLIFLWRRNIEPSAQLALTTIALFFLTPYAFDYELCLMLLPACWLARQALVNGWKKGERFLLFLIYFLPMALPLLALLTNVQLTFLLPVFLLYFVAKRMGDLDRKSLSYGE